MEEKSIYELELHEFTVLQNSLHASMTSGGNTTVIRVPGGWIYRFVISKSGGLDKAGGNAIALSSTFVPYHEEFKEK
jgi:hypothetical protein